jgi:hypothetical protein
MSPEQRAKALFVAVMEAGIRDEAEALIASAIRETENAAYERAAATAENAGGTWSGSRCVEQAIQEAAIDDKASEIAAAIRSLKSQEP